MMTRFLKAVVLCSISAQVGCRTAQTNDRSERVTWNVTVPADTPANAQVFICGGLPEVGAWNGHGAMLTKSASSTYALTMSLPRGETLEYKLTLGAWDTVEQSAEFTDIANRTLALDQPAQTVAITVAAWRDPSKVPAKKSTITGDVRFHRGFHSDALNSDRTIAVWLPEGYDASTQTRYPVLYMHDGQNVFDAASSFSGEWKADETATQLIAEKKIRPIIIVAFANGGASRIDEYTPTAGLDEGKVEGGASERTAHFLIDELKPFIDRTYRTLPDRANTAIAGSSLGGLNSLYLAWKHGDVFGLCGALSPSLWWDKRNMLIAFEADHAWMKNEKIWFDIGTAEGTKAASQQSAVANTRELHAIMKRAHLAEGSDYQYREFENAPHDESAWSARFDQVLTFLFGTTSK